MIDRFSQCIVENCRMLPTSVYVWLGVVLCVGTVLLWAFMGFRKGSRWAVGLLLVGYLLWIYSMTVIFRDVQAMRSFSLNPFWSYRAIKAGDPLLLVQDIMNVVAFIPVGLLLGYVFDKIRWWQVLLAGVLISLGIESLQFMLKRGFAEFDDVLHNGLGCLVGYGGFVGGSWLGKRVVKRRGTV